MSQVSLGGSGIMVLPEIGSFGFTETSTTSISIDAVGESVGGVGYLQWDDASSHVVSSSGGKIYFLTGNVTFGTGTTLRVGINDVDATTGLEDGTHDVYKDLVGGTDTITASAVNTATMGTGTKTIAHGALVAIVCEVTARTNPDSISIAVSNSVGAGLPYTTLDTGALAKTSTSMSLFLVESDDGHFGYLSIPQTIPHVGANTSFNSGSTPDEYALIFQVPFKCTINKLVAIIGEIDSGENGELLLYTDPTGTPSAARTVTMDPDVWASTTNVVDVGVFDITEYELQASTTYAIAYKATSAGGRNIRRVTSYTPAGSRACTIFGTTMQGGSRSDATGAFTAVSTDFPLLGFVINKLGTDSGGGGPVISAGMCGGFVN